MKDGRTITTIILVSALLGAGGASAGPPEAVQWVLATVKATGAGGEQFQSALVLSNPSKDDVSVDLKYLPQSPLDSKFTANGANQAPETIKVNLGGGQTLRIEDVLGTRFTQRAPHGIAAGAILMEASAPVAVLSQTFNVAARSCDGRPGTFGFTIPGARFDDLVSPFESALLPGLAFGPTGSPGFRSNVIFLNTGDRTTTVLVKLYRGSGQLVGERTYTLLPFASAQQGNIAASFGVGGAADANLFLTATVEPGGSPILVGASVIDNVIGSINFVAATKVP